MSTKFDTPARAAARARFAHLADDYGSDSGVIDRDNPPMTDADLASLRPADEVHPALVAAKSRGGRPKLDARKVPVSIRLDRDVVDALRAGGEGWQSRINAMLRVGLNLSATLPPTSAKQVVMALYDSREHANSAALELQQVGVSPIDVTLSPADAGTTHGGATGQGAAGFWASLERLFGDTDNHATYAEGVRRGGVLVTARVDDAQFDDAVRILEQHGSMDLDERETAWRSEGWTGVGVADRITSGDGSQPSYADRMTVGKRGVSHGRVRVRSYVVETPDGESPTPRDKATDRNG